MDKNKNRDRFTVDDTHYHKSGKDYARVSTILNTIHDPGIEKLQRAKGFWEFDNIMNQAGDRGQRFHNAMKLIANDKFSPMVDDSYRETQADIYQDIINARQWFLLNVEEVKHIEKTFFDDTHMIAGTVDLIARLKGDSGYTLIDYKTGSIITPRHRLQIGGYTYLIEKSGNIKIYNRIIIHAHGGNFEIIKIKTPKEIDKNLFLYTVLLHNNLIK